MEKYFTLLDVVLDVYAHKPARTIRSKMRKHLKEQYDEMLDEVYGEIKIGTLTFSPSRVLRELDPTAYRIGLSEYEDSLLEDEDYE